ncbi:di-heme-cytochrome C peroxidase [Thalassotalea euphylliae]|uniref:di-heme-cytochrome C peroxidase n=1 Tax=Thalassotalea euphylliae TaxID=1655234 RepID=UPI0036456AB0
MISWIFTKIKDALYFVFSGEIIRWFIDFLKSLTVFKVLKGLLIGFIGVVVIATIGLFALIHYPASQIPLYEPTDKTVYLDQGWGLTEQSPERQLYYYTAQGTSLKGFEYDWFNHLEMPWGRDRFADPNHMKAYGFIVDDQPTKANPHLYPLGFTKHYSTINDAQLLDITCSACHNGQLNYSKDGTRYAIRIDGGQAMHAFTTMKVGHFVPTLVASMASTYLNPFKFNRFARKVLGDEATSEAKSALKESFGNVLWAFVKQGYNDSSKHLYPVEEGFGRTDALARIGNTVFGDNLADENYHLATGPVSYPPVWNIWKFDWVQYGASVKQPMARNMGEALGVGAHIAFVDNYGRPLPIDQRFNSSVLAENIHDIETTLQDLTPPQWPEELFGKVDQEKAAKGKVLFQKHCQGCHGPHPANEMLKAIDMPLKTADEPVWIMKTLGIEEIGTDPNTAFNFVNNRFNLSKTGITSDEIIATVRPIHVRNLKRVTEQALKDPALVAFLSQPNPQTSQLHYQTDWLAQNQDTYKTLSKVFGSWESQYSDITSLDEKIAEYGDATVQSDIKTALVSEQLNKLDSVISSLNIESLTVGEALNLVGIMIREKHYKDKNYTEAQQACFDGFGALDMPQQPLAYKARPLEGIWATPPFLHNGSVPNIYQLLSPVSERDEKFFVGRREYDPVSLGYDTTPLSKSGFWFDTTIDGNLNTGHEFRAGYVPYKPGNPPQYGVIGPELTPDERWQLIEYLKIHKDNEKPLKKRDPVNCLALANTDS